MPQVVPDCCCCCPFSLLPISGLWVCCTAGIPLVVVLLLLPLVLGARFLVLGARCWTVGPLDAIKK